MEQDGPALPPGSAGGRAPLGLPQGLEEGPVCASRGPCDGLPAGTGLTLLERPQFTPCAGGSSAQVARRVARRGTERLARSGPGGTVAASPPDLSPECTGRRHRGRGPGRPVPLPALVLIRALPPDGRLEARCCEDQARRALRTRCGRPEPAASGPAHGPDRQRLVRTRLWEGRAELGSSPLPCRDQDHFPPKNALGAAGRPLSGPVFPSGASPAHVKTRWPRGRSRDWLHRSRAASGKHLQTRNRKTF